MGKVNWKWFIVGAALGYVGAVYVPKYIGRG